MNKGDIRRKALALREALSDEERERARVLLTERILGHQWFYRAGILLGYASYGSEINTGEILSEALRLGKEVYLPRVISSGAQPEMVFMQIHSMQELIPGYKGIPEPPEDGKIYEYSPGNTERVLMLMPGVAFDGMRNRIGYGKGFYDRYLADKPDLQMKTIGAGFLCQMVERIPGGEHDIKPYQVICV